MAVNLSLFAGAGAQFFDDNGVPLAGGLIYTYAAGTTTPAVTYTSSTGLIAHSNPIVLNAAGRVSTGEIWLTVGLTYKFILKNSAGVQIGSYDNIPSFLTTDSASVTYNEGSTGAVTTSVQAKLQEFVSVQDFGAVGNGVTDDATAFNNAANEAVNSGVVFVPKGDYLNGKPKGIVGENILWNYYGGGNSNCIFDITGSNLLGPFFAYESQAAQVLIAQLDEDQSAIVSPGFRDALFVNSVDSDTTDYTAIAQKVTHAVRGFTQGAHGSFSYVPQYKDLIGGFFLSAGNIQWTARGCSGVVADAFQYGIGIASNEFAVHNPAASAGGLGHSLSMAGVQAIIRSRFAPEDSAHESRGVLVTNNGERITAAFQALSATSDGYASQFKYGLDMRYADITVAGIIMPLNAYGGSNTGTIIEYDVNDYSFYDRTDNFFKWAIAGDVVFGATPSGLSIGGTTLASTRLFINAGTSALSQMRLFAGAAPTSPVNGDIWFDGTNLNIRVSGTTKTFNLT